MQSVLLLKITTTGQGSKKQFAMNMPDVAMAAPVNPAPSADLAEIKVLNESGEDISVSFPDSSSPCSPSVTEIAKGDNRTLPWKDPVYTGNYTFTVALQTADSSVEAGSGNVLPANGTIDLQVMG